VQVYCKGLFFKEKTEMGRTFHNGKGTRLYRIWKVMKTRCYNKNFYKYPRYGGRGIIVCEEWKTNFVAFRDWALRNGYADNLTIDRIDNNGNYEPLNCRWATNKVQSNNRSSCRLITYNGETHNITEWGEKLGINPLVLGARITRYKWDIQRAFTQPLKKRTLKKKEK
jgi:hypothetical protein